MKRLFFLQEENPGGEGAGGGSLGDRLGAPAGEFTDDFQGDTPPAGGTPAGDPPAGEVFKPSPIWDAVKDVEGFVMPETITPETELELLKPYVAKKFAMEAPVAVEPTLHPFAAKVQQLAISKPEASMTDILAELSTEFVDYKKMTADELIRMDLIDRYGRFDEETNKDGFTDEDIQESIDNMNKLDKRQRADHIREAYETRDTTKQAEYATVIEKQNEEAYNAYMGDLDKTVTELVAKTNNISDIYGVKLSQTELSEYIREFKELSIPDKTTGLRKLDTWLSNDLTLFKLFVMDLKQGEDSFKELITQGREDIKEKIFSQLGLTAPLEGSQGKRLNMQDPETIRRLLAAPDGTV